MNHTAMKKVIFILFTLHASLFTFHEAVAQEAFTPKVSKNVWFFKSKPIREMTAVLPGEHEAEPIIVPNNFARGTEEMKADAQPADPVILQRFQGNRSSRGPMLNFEGVGNESGGYPADPNGDVGPDHYVQGVNSSFGVWDKNGNMLYGPVDYNTIWESFPGPWDDLHWGDPVFKYDQLADRWVIISMAFNFNFQAPFYTMVAVSVGPDPLGEYYCYAFEFDKINDYPKLAVWPDGYYITYNMDDYDGGWIYYYSLVTVVDRESMLAGETEITMIEFQIPDPDIERFFPLATDMKGDSIPDDAPCYIVYVDDHDPGDPWHLWLDVYEFQTDWDVPGNSQFTLTDQMDLGNFVPMVDYGPGAPQLGSDINVITIPVYLMYPATYRNFGDYEVIVCCHTMWDGDIHYVKWYELRNEGSGWYMYQTGNYAPGDEHRYMPSITMNANGDIALGYSISSEEIYPSIRFTGRRAEDSLGVMTFQELELYNGLNYASSFDNNYQLNRWGDYSSMMVDPSDDSTFWYNNMYTTASSSPGNWATRIFSLDLSEDAMEPLADAGNDSITCNLLLFVTDGEAENYSSILWSTSGDGNFISNYSENATYLRGPGDLQNQQLTLTMNLTGYLTGSVAADSMILYINKEPEVNAGEDILIYADESVTLQGEVQYAYEYYWTTLGDGTFNDSTLLDAIYSPGPGDIVNGEAVLVLTANKVSPCSGSYSDSVSVFILPVGINDLTGNDLGLKIYPNPADDIVHVDAITASDDQLVLQIISIEGKIIFTGKYIPVNNHFETRFDLSYILPGIYFIRIYAGEDMITRKIVVQR